MSKTSGVGVVVGILGLALALTSCGSSSKSDSSSPAAENTFVLSEFTVIPPSNTLHSGPVTLTAKNVGGEEHELVIVRAASVNALPRKSDDSVDEDKIAASAKVGEIEAVAARSNKTKVFDLKAGDYVAFCNVVDSMMGSGAGMQGSGMGSGMGHVHFHEGMHVAFTVS